MSYINFADAQQAAMTFMIQQATILEAKVYEIKYPAIQYPTLLPVSTEGNEWAQSITFFSVDKAGRADWFSHMGNDIPLADISKEKFEQQVDMAAIGYRYTLQELGVAMLIPGTNLQTDRANAARRAYEEFMDDVAINGSTDKNWAGLVNNAAVTRVDAIADGTGSSALWTTKTADQIARDLNDQLTGVYTTTLTTEVADTILLPIDRFTYLATQRIPNTTNNLIDWIRNNNAYTALTGRPLTIRAVRGLDVAGQAGVHRAVFYRMDEDVLKLHLPMPHRFMPVWQTGPLVFTVPGIFRTGGTEIRRPTAMRYLDGI